MAATCYWLVIAVVLAEFVWSSVLTLLNIRSSHRPVPELLRDLYDEDRYRKQQDYAMANLTPHPVVVFTEYSHPALAERVLALTSRGVSGLHGGWWWKRCR